MSNDSHLTTFNQKERKLQLVVVVILIILLPILLALLQKALSIRSRAAPDASLRLVPRNVAKTADGKVKFTLNRQTPVDVVLSSGSNQVEIVEVGIFYDPAKMSLKKEGGRGIDNITCSQLTPVKHKVAAFVSGLTVDNNGNETGEEQGYASILCSALEGIQPDTNYTPIPANFTGAVATFMFTPIQTAIAQTLSIHFTPESPRSDSSILQYVGECCSDIDVLQSVEDLTFDIGPANTVAGLALSPSSGTFSANQTFDVQVNLSTGPHSIDSVDTLIEYDASALEAISVSEGVIFSSYTKNPAPSGISTSDTNGRIEISAHINPTSAQGLQGDNLLFATITFKALRAIQATDITVKVDQAGGRNDSNIVLFKTGTDVLEEVTNAQYQIVEQTITVTPTPTIDLFPASLRLSPVSGDHVKGREFDVSIYLTTGGEQVDATEVMLQYDADHLQITKVTSANLFPDFGHTSSATDSATNTSFHTILGLIGGQGQPVNANDQLFATVTFMPISTVDSTPVTIVHERGNRNDSNVSKYVSSTDILGTVTNANYHIVDSTSLIELIRILIALQGRQADTSSKAKEIRLIILGTHFEANPIITTTSAIGSLDVSTLLENHLSFGGYTMLVKPKGYLQKRVTASFNQKENTLDLRSTPFKAGDLDGSGAVNSLDWVKFLGAWLTDQDDADIDDSGQVNTFDNTYMLLNWFAQDEQ